MADWIQARFQLRPDDDDDDDASVASGVSFILRGSLRGSVEGGRLSWLAFLGGMGAGSSIQLR